MAEDSKEKLKKRIVVRIGRDVKPKEESIFFRNRDKGKYAGDVHLADLEREKEELEAKKSPVLKNVPSKKITDKDISALLDASMPMWAKGFLDKVASDKSGKSQSKANAMGRYGVSKFLHGLVGKLKDQLASAVKGGGAPPDMAPFLFAEFGGLKDDAIAKYAGMSETADAPVANAALLRKAAREGLTAEQLEELLAQHKDSNDEAVDKVLEIVNAHSGAFPDDAALAKTKAEYEELQKQSKARREEQEKEAAELRARMNRHITDKALSDEAKRLAEEEAEKRRQQEREAAKAKREEQEAYFRSPEWLDKTEAHAKAELQKLEDDGPPEYKDPSEYKEYDMSPNVPVDLEKEAYEEHEEATRRYLWKKEMLRKSIDRIRKVREENRQREAAEAEGNKDGKVDEPAAPVDKKDDTPVDKGKEQLNSDVAAIRERRKAEAEGGESPASLVTNKDLRELEKSRKAKQDEIRERAKQRIMENIAASEGSSEEPPSVDKPLSKEEIKEQGGFTGSLDEGKKTMRTVHKGTGKRMARMSKSEKHERGVREVKALIADTIGQHGVDSKEARQLKAAILKMFDEHYGKASGDDEKHRQELRGNE